MSAQKLNIMKQEFRSLLKTCTPINKRTIDWVYAFLALSLLIFGQILYPMHASGEDSIHASITVHEDASVTITETIHIESGKDWFNNQLDRDLPTAQQKFFGMKYLKGFQLLKCLRDGKPETCTIFHNHGVMIRIGDSMDMSDIPQVRTYTLTYRLDNQIVSEGEGDRLTWTVTEKYWGWWPLKASTSVRLPGDASAHIKDSKVLIGYEGREEIVNGGAERDHDGVLHFVAPRRLDQSEGFSISLTWPKGYLKKSAAADIIRQLAADNRGILIGIGGLAVLLVYYSIVWMLFGRGPAKGTIVVQYDPPQGMSPAFMRFVRKMGYDDRCFTAALLDMAVKGHLKISEDSDKQYIISRSQGSIPLSTDEVKIMNQLLPHGGNIYPEREERRISTAVNALTEHLRLNFEKDYFVGNLKYFGCGLLISGVIVVASGLGDLSDPLDMVMFVCASVVMAMGSPPFIVAVPELLKRWKSALTSGGAKGIRIFKAVFFTIAAALFCRIGFEVLSDMIDIASPYVVVFLAAAVVINYAFYQFMKAPTRAGRKLHDEIEGFRQFLRITEEERRKLMDLPDRTPELFNRYFPYALALDLEQEWSEQFSDILSGAAITEAQSFVARRQGNIVSIISDLLRSR